MGESYRLAVFFILFLIGCRCATYFFRIFPIIGYDSVVTPWPIWHVEILWARKNSCLEVEATDLDDRGVIVTGRAWAIFR